MPKGVPKEYKACGRCGDRHHQWARCNDGVRQSEANGSAPAFKKGDPLRGAAKKVALAKVQTSTSAPAEAVSVGDAATITTATQAREDLRALAASLPEGSQQRKSIDLLVARDEAREQHAHDEAEIQKTDPGAHLPIPTILRDPSEERGRALNMEMDRALFASGLGSAALRDALPKEAKVVHDTLTDLPAKREQAEREAEKAQGHREHRPGEQPWRCTACGQRFRSGTLDEVRDWARKDASWHFVCPECGSGKVQLIEAA